MHFDPTDLRLFLHVVEAGSITAGAARAGLSLASASTRVRGWRTRLGCRCWSRGGAGWSRRQQDERCCGMRGW
ncbi:helix-turn-helix domain-containing protein [Muricoccus vinaceus]|uniref:LysR family transcriptional regulator n=1 Tax=Muricoccus vinaceus TaxID=424704 RepID=A0ABV6IST9_9PROT